MNIKDNILIFSVYNPGQSEKANKLIHEGTLKDLKARGISPMGLQERDNRSSWEYESILVKGFENENLVKGLVETNSSMDCYLKSHNDRATELVWLDGTSEERSGYLVPIYTKDEANTAIRLCL